jgi:hypothetical protein
MEYNFEDPESRMFVVSIIAISSIPICWMSIDPEESIS